MPTLSCKIGEVNDSKSARVLEPPFVVGVIADLSGRQDIVSPQIKNKEFVYVDRDSYQSYMASVQPNLTLSVKNTLDSDPTPLEVQLIFESPNAFKPDAVVAQVEPLRRRAQDRSKLDALANNPSLYPKTVGHFHEISSSIILESASGPRRDQLRARLEPILVQSLVDELHLSKEVALHLFDLLFRTDGVLFAKPGAMFVSDKNLVSKQLISDLVGELDKELSEQVSAILHASDFQRLESAWLGLEHLVYQAETNEVLKIRVLNISKEEVFHSLISGPTQESELYRSIVANELFQFGGEPFGIFLCDFEIGNLIDDLELLRRLGSLMACLEIPLIAGASGKLLNLDTFLGAEGTPKVHQRSDFSDAWDEIRSTTMADHILLAGPRFLARVPYHPDTNPAATFRFSENSNRQEDFLWANSAYAICVSLCDEYRETGWCRGSTNAKEGVRADGIHAYGKMGIEGKVSWVGPIEGELTERQALLLFSMGISIVHGLRSGGASCFPRLLGRTATRTVAPSSCLFPASDRMRLERLLIGSRFWQCVIAVVRESTGLLQEPSSLVRFLDEWLMQYVAAEEARPTKGIAAFDYPLSDAKVILTEGKDGHLSIQVFLRINSTIRDSSAHVDHHQDTDREVTYSFDIPWWRFLSRTSS